MQQDTGSDPNYVYTESGIFRINDDLIVQDLCTPVCVPKDCWKNMFQQQTCFSADAIVDWIVEAHQQNSQLAPVFDEQNVIVTRRMVQPDGADKQEQVAEVAEVCWFLRVIVPTDPPGSKRNSTQRNSSVPLGENFLWPMTLRGAQSLYSTLMDVHSENADFSPTQIFQELFPTHEATDLSTWSTHDAIPIEYMPNYYDRLFALSVAPALHKPRTTLGSSRLVPALPGEPPSTWFAPQTREWLSKSMLAHKSLIEKPGHVRPSDLCTGLHFDMLPDDVAGIIFDNVVTSCSNTVQPADFQDLMKLRTVCKGWKNALEDRVAQRLSTIVTALKGAIHAEDTLSLMRVRDLVLGHGLPIPRLLGDARSLDFYNFVRLRFRKRPGALPPDMPRKRALVSEGTAKASNKRLALALPFGPMGPVIEG